MKKLKFNRKFFALPYAVVGTIFVVIPLIILLYYALIDKATGAFTFKNFINFFAVKATQNVMLNSLGMAALTTIICLVMAYPLALILANSKINKSAILVMLFILPMWINSLLRIYAMKSIYEIIKLSDAYLRVLFAMVYDFFPFMLLPIYTILANMDKSLSEAALDLGANPLKTFLKVKLPLSLPGIMSGVLMVFMPTVSTFAISDIVGDTTTYMFGNIINQYFEKGNWNVGAAYAFILLVLIAIVMVIANLVSKGKATALASSKSGGAL